MPFQFVSLNTVPVMVVSGDRTLTVESSVVNVTKLPWFEDVSVYPVSYTHLTLPTIYSV